MYNLLVSLHLENMEEVPTYQKDTIKARSLLKNLTGLPEPGNLNIERTAPVPLGPIPEREILDATRDSADAQVKPAPSPYAQLRYRWWQQEQNLLVGDSRYMKPRNEEQSVSAIQVVHDGFRLPSRMVTRINYDWITILLLLALVLFASVRTSWDKYLGNLFHSVVNYSTSFRMFQEKNSSVSQGIMQLDILFYIVFSLFLFQVFTFFQTDLTYRHFSLYLFSLVLVIGYFFLKKLIYRGMGFIVEKTTETGEYLFNMDNFNRVAGLVLLPMVALTAFYPFQNVRFPATIGVIIFLFLYFSLLFRGFLILLKKQFSIFYLFLYFCTLEFLPLVLLYKILVV